MDEKNEFFINTVITANRYVKKNVNNLLVIVATR